MNSNGAETGDAQFCLLPGGDIKSVNPFVTVHAAFMEAFCEVIERDIISEMTEGATLQPLVGCNNTIKLENSNDDE